VVHASIAELIDDLTSAMAEDRGLTSFKIKYHACDVLLIDDIQYLEGKEGTTNAIIEIFTNFIENHKQIVLSADRSPIEVNISKRLIGRFAQGVTVDIRSPGSELKTAILKKYKHYYCNYLNIPEIELSDEVIEQIVNFSGSDIRELEGVVHYLVARASFNNPDHSLAQEDIKIITTNLFHKNVADEITRIGRNGNYQASGQGSNGQHAFGSTGQHAFICSDYHAYEAAQSKPEKGTWDVELGTLQCKKISIGVFENEHSHVVIADFAKPSDQE